jgi:hypothetical protein
MTKTIGDLDTARMLSKHFEDRDPYEKRAPRGFNKLGAGCYRTAFLEKATKTVYKIGSYEANRSEAYNARRLRKKSTRNLPFDLYIPHTRTWQVGKTTNRFGRSYPLNVIAQEFAEGAKFTHCDALDTWIKDVKCNCKSNICFAKIHQMIVDFSDLEDIHSGNILVDKNNVFWFIDLAA